MIFGDKFYVYLNNLRPWQQSLFALILAERMRINYLLFCQMTDDKKRDFSFNNAINTMWKYHSDKFNHIDLKALAKSLDKLIFEANDEASFGVLAANDAVGALMCAVNAIVEKKLDEAVIASNISEQCVARFIAVQRGEELSDDDLLEDELMQEEMNFQIDLMNQFRMDDRSKIKPLVICDEIRSSKVSNIGISLD